MTKLETNLKILDIVANYIKANPDQRFCQVLCNLGLPYISTTVVNGSVQHVDKFYEESDKTLEGVKQAMPQYPQVNYQWNPRSRRHEKVQVQNTSN